MLGGIAGSLLSIPFEEKFTHSSIAIHCIANKARKFSSKFGLALELLVRIPPPPGCLTLASGQPSVSLSSASLRLPTLGYTFVSPLISALSRGCSRACPGARLSFTYSPSAAVSSARETDHGLPGLAVKNETAASSLVEVCFLVATFVQRMRQRRIL